MAVGLVAFFFSSRRRHTRLVSDWSSDVCSSDLGQQWGYGGAADKDYLGSMQLWTDFHDYGPKTLLRGFVIPERSEERRVGKECRSGWWEDDGDINGRTDVSEGRV